MFFFSSRRRHTRSYGDWSSDVCSSDLVRVEQCAAEHSFHSGAERLNTPPGDVVADEIPSYEAVTEQWRKAVARIAEAADNNVSAIHSVVLHMRKEPVCVGVVQRTVLSEVLLIIPALYAMPEQRASVGAVEKPAVRVECQAINVPTTFGKQLHLTCARVISPDTLLEFEISNLGRGRTAVQSVKPAIRTPGEVVRHGLGILHSKATEEHLGITVGNIIAISIRIEKQVRRLYHENAAVTECNTRAKVQAFDEVFELVGAAVAVGVFENCDP